MKGNHPTLTILSIIIMTFSKLLAVLILVGLLPKMEFVGNRTKMKRITTFVKSKAFAWFLKQSHSSSYPYY